MAWNRNKPSNRKTWPWSRNRPWSRKKISVKQLPRSVARKRTDWVYLYNDTGEIGPTPGPNEGCQIRCIEFGGSNCDEASVRFPIMPEGAVAALYDDDVTIAEMRGFINMKPRWFVYNGCETANWLQRMSGEQWPIYMRAGLYKQELTTGQGGIPPFVNPNIGDDWTDISVLKRWQHIWQPRGRHGSVWQQSTKIVGVCSDTERAQYTVPATSSGSQPLYNVPAISTECSLMTVGSGEGACNVADLYFERESHAWYRMSLNRRRPIRLHENDSLDVFMNWSIPRPGDDCGALCGATADGFNPCAMEFSMSLAVRLQFG